jgi:hypothetical protein
MAVYTKGRQMRIFMSGPITGTKDYLERFAAAERELSRRGYEVINPAKVLAVVPIELSWDRCMDITIALLRECDAIYMLDKWEWSAGARVEHEHADKAGYRMIYQKDVIDAMAQADIDLSSLLSAAT